MARLLIALVVALALLGGIAAGLVLKPEAAPAGLAVATDAEKESDLAEPTRASASRDFVRLNNQFIVPVVERGRVEALVILTLSMEVESGGAARVRSYEPKLRDALLQTLFDHANNGGFSGNFTQAAPMRLLRQALREAAGRILGPNLTDVLIVDMVRQDN
jgi:flagellar protein FliL